MSRRWAEVILLAALAAYTGVTVPERFALVKTPSIPYTLFYLERSPVEVKKGDYVLICGIASEFVNAGRPFNMVKKVVCVPGDVLSVEGRDYYCNGRLVAVAKERSLKGDLLPRFEYAGSVPENMMFVAGSHKDSFDSRYLGFMKFTEVAAVAYPLF